MEFGGKKGCGGSGRLLGQLRSYKSGHRGLGALDGARKPRGLSEVRPEVVNERRQQYFSRSSTRQRNRTTSWQAEDDGWRVREETVHGKRVGKTSGMILSFKEQWEEPRRVPKGF